MIHALKDHPLSQIVAALAAKNIQLGKARNDYLQYEAQRKHFEAVMISQSSGASHAQKTTEAQAKDSWFEFHKKLARAEAEYEFHKLEFKILELEYQSQYLQLKLDQGLIGKGAE